MRAKERKRPARAFSIVYLVRVWS